MSCMLESNACSLVKRGGVLFTCVQCWYWCTTGLGFASWIDSGCGMGQSSVWAEVGGAWLINVLTSRANAVQCCLHSNK